MVKVEITKPEKYNHEVTANIDGTVPIKLYITHESDEPTCPLCDKDLGIYNINAPVAE